MSPIGKAGSSLEKAGDGWTGPLVTGSLVSVECDRLHLLAGRDIRQCLLLGSSSQGRAGGGGGSEQLLLLGTCLGWLPVQSTPTMSCTGKVLLLCTPSLLGGSGLAVQSEQGASSGWEGRDLGSCEMTGPRWLEPLTDQ